MGLPDGTLALIFHQASELQTFFLVSVLGSSKLVRPSKHFFSYHNSCSLFFAINESVLPSPHTFLVPSLVAQLVTNLPAMLETQVWSLGWEDPLEKAMATHSSILAWEIPWTEGPGGLQFVELNMTGWLNDLPPISPSSLLPAVSPAEP